MKVPERLETARLILTRPAEADLEEIFARYAGDPEVTRFMAWPRHDSLQDTGAFLEFSDTEWNRWPGGPYLMRSRSEGTLVGGTGLAFETSYRASTGYVLARDAWGRGLATEALQAMVAIARTAGILRLYALCHTGNQASWHVLEKCRFRREGILYSHMEFPNWLPGRPCDVYCYALVSAPDRPAR